MSKNFTKDATKFFVSETENEEIKETLKEEVEEKVEERETAPKNLKKIKGYVIDPKYYRETKSHRLQILARPSTVAELKKRAKKLKLSTNELVNNIIESYLDGVKE